MTKEEEKMYVCPHCGKDILHESNVEINDKGQVKLGTDTFMDLNFCPWCGQKMNWKKKDD